MNKRIKAQWIRALLSGKYKQGFSYLKQTDAKGVTKYCCLGVLTELAKKSRSADAPKLIKTDTSYSDGVVVSSFKFLGETQSYTTLPPSVQRWAGIDSELGVYCHTTSDRSLAIDNDSGKTFKQIAKIIEREL